MKDIQFNSNKIVINIIAWCSHLHYNTGIVWPLKWACKMAVGYTLKEEGAFKVRDFRKIHLTFDEVATAYNKWKNE